MTGHSQQGQSGARVSDCMLSPILPQCLGRCLGTFSLLKYSWLLMLISAIQQSNPDIHLYVCSFPWWFITGYWIQSLCSTAGPYCLSILCIVVGICSPRTPNPSLYTLTPWQPPVCCLQPRFYFCFLGRFICHVLESTYKCILWCLGKTHANM